MERKISHLEPKGIWSNFEDICQIPHPSKKEEKIIQFMLDFGNRLGLETFKDVIGNVIIKKKATPGFENKQGVVLQSHLDMVPQKNNETDHDFEKDTIKAYVDGDWVTAEGTTLGADNGIGVATIMTILEATDIEHGPIEALFTIDEETGMTGAFGLKSGLLDGDILLNLDSEDEGEIYIGCAGGIDTTAFFEYEKETPNGSTFKLTVKGLKGGHSGCDIEKGRGNANKIINRFLWEGVKNHGIQISYINGGSLRNAIPREATATIVIPEEHIETFHNYIDQLSNTIKHELELTEPNIIFEFEATDAAETIIDHQTALNFTNSIYACFNGVYGMCVDLPDVVETSSNLASVKFQKDSNRIRVGLLQRSSVDSSKMDLCNTIRASFELAGAKVDHSGAYPGWKPNPKSEIVTKMKTLYKDRFDTVPAVKVIHAGLECGIIGEPYPNFDMVSFGPTIVNPHSPDEAINIKTVTKFWDFLLDTLKEIPAK